MMRMMSKGPLRAPRVGMITAVDERLEELAVLDTESPSAADLTPTVASALDSQRARDLLRAWLAQGRCGRCARPGAEESCHRCGAPLCFECWDEHGECKHDVLTQACRQWATWQLPNGTRWCLWHAAHLSRSLRKELRAVTATRTCQGRPGQHA